MKMTRPLWIEIDLAALRRNYKNIRRLLGPQVKIIATIKQSAYGHGLIQVARELDHIGADYFGVASLEEAWLLRQVGLKQPILVLTAVLDEFCGDFLKYKITPTVVDLGFARKLNRAAAGLRKVIPVHVKVDTGMGRLGPHYKQAEQFILSLSRLKNIRLEGIFTHFPVADSDSKFTNRQIACFNQLINRLTIKGVVFKYHHCANSIGIIKYPHSHFNMVRPGLILYGVSPAPNIKVRLRPVLSLRSRVVFVKRIKKGMSVSYGRRYIARRPTTIATVACGYADGYPWAATQALNSKNPPRVIIKDRFFRLAGTVCMDHIMVDVGSRKVKVGQEVVLIGQKGKLKITAQDLADWAGTICYEVMSHLSLRIPRRWRKGRAVDASRQQ